MIELKIPYSWLVSTHRPVTKTGVGEYWFGGCLEEKFILRRCNDDWINATHILKVAGLDKNERTRFLGEVHKKKHEKVQGGNCKYQG